MSIYKKALRKKLRFQTQKGELSVEQLWSLSLTSLAEGLKTLKKKLNEKQGNGDLDFLDTTVTEETSELQLRFDILKDIYLTKKDEREQEKSATQKKENNEKILALIYEKENEELKGKSVEELKAMLQ